MTEPQYTVGTDEQGRFTIVDQSNYPHVYPVPGKRYTDREVAQERADRYNAIKGGAKDETFKRYAELKRREKDPALWNAQRMAIVTCRPVEIDGQTVLVRGSREMDETDKAALGEVIRAAQARFAKEPVQRWVLINENCGHLAGVTNTKHMLMAYKIKLVINGYKGWRVEQRDFTDEEATALLDAERCVHCTIDGDLRQVIR